MAAIFLFLNTTPVSASGLVRIVKSMELAIKNIV